jgi:hypothetical protein
MRPLPRWISIGLSISAMALMPNLSRAEPAARLSGRREAPVGSQVGVE